jgi:hypothetical protein
MSSRRCNRRTPPRRNWRPASSAMSTGRDSADNYRSTNQQNEAIRGFSGARPIRPRGASWHWRTGAGVYDRGYAKTVVRSVYVVLLALPRWWPGAGPSACSAARRSAELEARAAEEQTDRPGTRGIPVACGTRRTACRRTARPLHRARLETLRRWGGVESADPERLRLAGRARLECRDRRSAAGRGTGHRPAVTNRVGRAVPWAPPAADARACPLRASISTAPGVPEARPCSHWLTQWDWGRWPGLGGED